MISPFPTSMKYIKRKNNDSYRKVKNTKEEGYFACPKGKICLDVVGARRVKACMPPSPNKIWPFSIYLIH